MDKRLPLYGSIHEGSLLTSIHSVRIQNAGGSGRKMILMSQEQRIQQPQGTGMGPTRAVVSFVRKQQNLLALCVTTLPDRVRRVGKKKQCPVHSNEYHQRKGRHNVSIC